VSRPLTAIRFGYRTLLLLAPQRAMTALAGMPIDRPTRITARVLGARELVQTELMRRHPSRAVRLTGAGVDAVHALSMLALSRTDSSRRGPARRSAVSASVWALSEAMCAVR
jgi:hypothetical protein